MPPFTSVSAPTPIDTAPKHESTQATLGDVLHANRASVPAAESAWVALVQRIGSSDERALRTLYDHTHRLVFTLIVRITGDRAMSEELTLDVFHDIWRRAAGFDPQGGTVVGWIMNQARSRAIDRLRFEQRKKRVNPFPEMTGLPAVERPDETVDSIRSAQILRGALRELSAKEREAIERAYLSEKSYAEVAEELAEPLGTVKTRIRSGLLKLRRALAEAGQR